jgi:hypothetical protein
LFRFNRNIDTLCFGVKAKQPKQTKTNRKKTKLLEKIPKYAPYQTVLVGILFVSIQSKHRKSLFQYRSETTEMNVMFQFQFRLFRMETSFEGHPNRALGNLLNHPFTGYCAQIPSLFVLNMDNLHPSIV